MIFLLALLAAAVVLGLPSLRYAFGLIFWDVTLLPIYEGLRLYRVWALLLALIVGIGFWYIAARPFWWRYGMNKLAFNLGDILLRAPWLARTYISWRHWLAKWYPGIRARLVPPILFTRGFAQSTALLTEGYLPPSRRYLAIVRARIDTLLDECQELLDSSVEVEHLTTSTAHRLTDELDTWRANWCDHQQLPHWQSWHTTRNLVALDSNTFEANQAHAPVEPVASAAIIALEQLSVASAFNRTLPVDRKLKQWYTDLLDEVRINLELLTSDHTQVATLLDRLLQLAAFDGNPMEAFAIVIAANEPPPLLGKNLVSWVIHLDQLLLTFAVERLVSYKYFQEAVEVSYVREARPEPDIAYPHTFVAAQGSWWSEWLVIYFFSDRWIPAPEWAARLAAPTDNRQQRALLAEAWSALAVSLQPKSQPPPDDEQAFFPIPGQRLRDNLAYAVRADYHQVTSDEAAQYRSDAGDSMTAEEINDGRSTMDVQRYRTPSAHRERRVLLLAELERIPPARKEAVRRLQSALGWRRLGVDFWSTSVYCLFSLVAVIITLSLIIQLYLTQSFPPAVALIGDARLSRTYTNQLLTSAALAGKDWLVIGTKGGGVEAYLRASGRIGLWHTHTGDSTEGALPSDTINAIGATEQDVWYVADDGLAWSSPDLRQWQEMIGLAGFSAAPRQEAIIDTDLSPDGKMLAVATIQTLGLYDIQRHRWVSEVTPGAPIRSIAFFGEKRIFVGTASGLFAYEADPQAREALKADLGRTVTGAAVRALRSTGSRLFAVTDGDGLLGLVTDGPSWRTLIGDEGFGGQPIDTTAITAVLLDEQHLWVTSGPSIGRYNLEQHSWETWEPDDTAVLALATFGGGIWAGTEQGLYRNNGAEWQFVTQARGVGAQQLIAGPDRLWVVTADGGFGSVGADGAWQSVISTTPAGPDEPSITDVVVSGTEFWVASANQGVASYSWKRREWTRHEGGLPTAPVVDLHTDGSGIWAMVGAEQTPSYNLYRWSTNTWQKIEDVRAVQLVTVSDSTWALEDNGELIPVGSQSQGSGLFRTVTMKPANFQAYTIDESAQQVLVASNDGLFAYNLSTRSWSQLNTIPSRAVATGDAGPLVITPQDGLVGNARLLPDRTDAVSLETPVTAALWRAEVWISDGPRVAKYNPATRILREVNGISGESVTQLRVADDTLWAITERGDESRIYQYDEQDETWEQITTANPIVEVAVLSNSIVLRDTGGGLTTATRAGVSTALSGAFSGVSAATGAAQTSDGRIFLISPDGGLGIYSPSDGSWRNILQRQPSQLLVTNDFGSEQVFTVSADGLAEIAQDSLQANLIASQVRQIARAGGRLYTLSPGTNRIDRFEGAGLTSVLAFSSPTTAITVGAELVPLLQPTELVGFGDTLYVRHGSEVVAYQAQGDTLSATLRAALPEAGPEARLVEGDGAAALYFGNPTQCWRLQGAVWTSCSSATLLAQTRTSFSDGVGRTWNRSPFAVQVAGLEPAGFFVSDRASNLGVDGDDLVVRSTDGDWLVSVTGGRINWAGRVPSSLPTKSASAIDLPVGDPWRWRLSADPVTLKDQLSIVWPTAPSVARRRINSGFADDVATAIAFFDGRYWLGTEGGIFDLGSAPQSMSNVALVTEVPPSRVVRMIVSNDALTVALEGGIIWQYRQGEHWIQVPTLPAPKTVTDSLGSILFEESNGRLRVAPMTDSPTPRFLTDQMLSVTARGGTLWLGSAAGIVRAELVDGGVGLLAVERPSSSAESDLLLTDNGQYLFAQESNAGSVTFLRQQGNRWEDIAESETPFAIGATLNISLPDAPLNWRRTNDSRIEPVLTSEGGFAIPWLDGRFATDIVSGVALSNDTLIIGTTIGPFGYKPGTDDLGLIAVPAEGVRSPVDEVGQDNTSIWMITQNNVARVSIEGSTVVSKMVEASAQPAQPGVQMLNGKWARVDISRTEPPLGIPGAPEQASIFATDGRFIFDQVRDVAALGELIHVAGEKGITTFDRLPLTQIATRVSAPVPGSPIEAIAATDAGIYTLAGNSYRLTQAGWEADPDGMVHLLPRSVIFSRDGWRTQGSEGRKLQIAGLEEAPILFNERGKFIFDTVLSVATTRTDTWLLTQGGWVYAKRIDSGEGFQRFEIFGVSAPPSGITVLRSGVGQGTLVADIDAPNPARLTWQLVDQVPNMFVQEPAVDHILALRAYQVSAVSPEGMVLSSGNTTRMIKRAASPFWQSDDGLMAQSIGRAVSFLEERGAIWVISDRGLIQLHKGRLGINEGTETNLMLSSPTAEVIVETATPAPVTATSTLMPTALSQQPPATQESELPSPSRSTTAPTQRPTGTPRPTNIPRPSPTVVPAGPARIQIQDVNLRPEPGLENQEILVIQRGRAIEVFGEARRVDESTWVQVRFEGRSGWVNQRFVRPMTSVTEGPRARVVGVDPDTLLVRRSPNQNAAVITRLAEGAELEIFETILSGGETWRRVRVDQDEGWVRDQYLVAIQ